MSIKTVLYIGLLTTLQCLSASALRIDPVREVGARSLAAASTRSQERPRSDAIEFCNSAELVYADGNSIHNGQSFAAKVSISSARPILVLEDFEHLFGDIACDAQTITLARAPSGQSWERDYLSGLVDGHIITSHHGCNPQHARRPYKVQAIEFPAEDILVLTITPAIWQTSFSGFKVSMGYTPDTHHFRTHTSPFLQSNNLKARQAQATGTPSLVPFNSSNIPTVVAPSAVPSSSATSYEFNLANSLINKSLGPFKTPAGNLPIEIGCVNCTTFGLLDVTFASFDWTCSFTHSVEMDDVSDCLTGGANITTKGLGAHMLMSANLSDSFSFEVPVGQLQAKFSITIPEIGTASVVFGSVLAGGYDLNGKVGMTYGFDLRVPDGADMVLDVVDPAGSSISGFENSQITALPIQRTIDMEGLKMYIALRAVIKASFDFQEHFDMSGDFGAGVYVDLPVLSANITKVANVDANCKPLSSAALAANPSSNVTSAIGVDFAAGFDFGAYVKAEAKILGQPFDADDQNVNFQKLFPIDAGCFDFRNNSNGGKGSAFNSDKTNTAPGLAVWSSVPLLVGLFVVSSVFSML